MPNFSIYDPRTMGEVIRRNPPVKTFFKSTFFKKVKTFVTPTVDVDFKKGSRKLAPFVSRKVGGKIVPNTGYYTKTYTPPLVSPEKVTTIDDLLKRAPGESLTDGLTPADRAVAKMSEDFRELDEMITRREEWMIAQAIYTGKIPIIGEGVDEEIDFNFTHTETLAGAKKWSGKDADIIGDLRRWRKTVQIDGFVNANICIVSDDVVDVMLNNEKFKSLLDVKRYELAVIQPRELPSGATYIGTISLLGMDIYSYNEWYLDDWSNPAKPINQPLVPDGTVVLMSTNAEYEMYYGEVTLMKGSDENATFITSTGARIPDTYTKRKPARRFLQINSAPLPVPQEVDSWFVAKVL